MEHKHTQGPWQLDKAISPRNAPIIYSPSAQRVVCALHYEHVAGSGDYGAFDNLEANAALIAAAPDMLRALELILNSDMAMREEDEGEISTELSHARAAVSKAVQS